MPLNRRNVLGLALCGTLMLPLSACPAATTGSSSTASPTPAPAATPSLLGDWTAHGDYQKAMSWSSKTFKQDGTYKGYLSYPLPEAGGYWSLSGNRLLMQDAAGTAASNSADVPIHLTTALMAWEVFSPDGTVDGFVGNWTMKIKRVVNNGQAQEVTERLEVGANGTCRFQSGNLDLSGTYKKVDKDGIEVDVKSGNFGLVSTYYLLSKDVLGQVNKVFKRP